MKKLIVIAEAGVNHNGDISKAFDLVDVAADARADYVKFQSFRADKLVTRNALKAEYQKLPGNEETQFEMLRKLELTDEMFLRIKAHCESRKIGFLSTPYDLKSIQLLEKIGVSFHKIPSGEITNLPFLRLIARTKRPIILSTGMSTVAEIGSAINVLVENGVNKNDLTLLHCTSEYPAPYNDVNLRAMISIGAEFDINYGYSDHTEGIEVSIAAAAMGASVIEKHFTLDKSLPGPDHKASLDPEELKRMVLSIRNIEMALGDGIKHVTMSESRNRCLVRRSIVAKTEIKYGEVMTEDNLTVKRPGQGISPMKWDEIIGKIATKNYRQDEMIDEILDMPEKWKKKPNA